VDSVLRTLSCPKDRFLLYKDNDWGILIYATNENLENLRQCSDIYCDGTFGTCPKPYEQYFTIHGKYRSRVLCFVYCLMTDCKFWRTRSTGKYLMAITLRITFLIHGVVCNLLLIPILHFSPKTLRIESTIV
jgi:hypothetical protein